MKKLFLFLALLSASSALAQSAKVLVCAPGDLAAAKSLDSTLQKFYYGKIDVSDTITEVVNNYEAIFVLLLQAYDPRTSTGGLTLEGGILLRKFLHSNNKLYLQFELPALGLDFIDSNGLSKFLNISGGGAYDVFETDTIIGKNGTFTEGIYFPNIKVTEISSIRSNATPILFAKSMNEQVAMSDMYETDSFKVILNYFPLKASYEAFLGRVLCNYFVLCTPLNVKPSEENQHSDFSLFPNPARDILHIWSNTDNPGLQSAELISETGSLVSKFSVDGNMNHIDLDLGSKNLSSGNYFLRLNMERGSFVKQVFIK
jgi:hypothetical protein